MTDSRVKTQRLATILGDLMAGVRVDIAVIALTITLRAVVEHGALERAPDRIRLPIEDFVKRFFDGGEPWVIEDTAQCN